MKEKKTPVISYICDRKKCEVCNEDCHHTLDINHAANFKFNGTFYEEVKADNVHAG